MYYRCTTCIYIFCTRIIVPSVFKVQYSHGVEKHVFMFFFCVFNLLTYQLLFTHLSLVPILFLHLHVHIYLSVFIRCLSLRPHHVRFPIARYVEISVIGRLKHYLNILNQIAYNNFD